MSYTRLSDYEGNMTLVEIQTALNALGYPAGPVDGKYGPKTKAAVEKFQAVKGLKVDGIPGPGTQAMIQKVLAASSSTGTLFPETLTRYLTPVVDTAKSIVDTVTSAVKGIVGGGKPKTPGAKQATLFGLPLWMVLGGGAIAFYLHKRKGGGRRRR